MKPAVDVRLDRIAMVIVYAKDPLRSVAFFRDRLGMRVLEASEHWAELDGGGIHLAIHPHREMPAKRDPAAPWVVFEVDDVRGTYEALRARGVEFLGPPKEVCGDATWAGLSADFEDPDGNRFSVFGKVARS
jgi:catechol 2,3-dioxygenase-like lactoylglutathione lyase family enzyme